MGRHDVGRGLLTQTIVFLIGAAILTVLTPLSLYRINARNRYLAENLDAGKSSPFAVGITASDAPIIVANGRYSWKTDDQAPLTDGSFQIVRLDGTRIRVERL